MTDFGARLDAVERRLAQAALDPEPAGLTEPDPDTPEERWQAAQVWAHLAEIVGYWQDQLALVTAHFDRAPVPFGRTKRDPARIAAIEAGRQRPIGELVTGTRQSVVGLRLFLAALPPAAWQAVGVHATLGEMNVSQIVERFLVGHLEEHLDQLDRLRTR
jgi:hypothetical protein